MEGAVLVPVLENGSVTDVKIVEPGLIDAWKTVINVLSWSSEIQTYKLRVNLFVQHFNYLS